MYAVLAEESLTRLGSLQTLSQQWMLKTLMHTTVFLIVLRRLRIHYNNIVSLLHGITSSVLPIQQSSKFTLINIYRRNHPMYPFLSCSRTIHSVVSCSCCGAIFCNANLAKNDPVASGRYPQGPSTYGRSQETCAGRDAHVWECSHQVWYLQLGWRRWYW